MKSFIAFFFMATACNAGMIHFKAGFRGINAPHPTILVEALYDEVTSKHDWALLEVINLAINPGDIDWIASYDPPFGLPDGELRNFWIVYDTGINRLRVGDDPFEFVWYGENITPYEQEMETLWWTATPVGDTSTVPESFPAVPMVIAAMCLIARRKNND